MGFLFAQNAISIYKNEAKSFDIQVSKNSGIVYDLTTSVVYVSVRKKITDEYTIISKSSANPLEISISLPRTGVIRIFFLPQDTKLVDPGIYTYDVWVVDATNSEQFPAIEPSEFEVKSSVTRF